MSISIKDVEKLAILARFDLTQQEKDQFLGEINTIMADVRNLQEPDTENISSTINILPFYNVMREDITQTSLDQKSVFQNTAYEEDGMFRVPKIL